jgi:hypothetical protein
MSSSNRNIKKRRLMDKIDQKFNKYEYCVNQHGYLLNDMLSEFYINDNPWLVKLRPHKVGLFMGVKPRVK